MDMTAGTPADAAQDGHGRPGLFERLWHQRLTVAMTFGFSLLLVLGVLLALPISYVATGSVIAADHAEVESTVLLIRSPRLLRALIAEPALVNAIEADCAALARRIADRLRPVDCTRLAEDPDARVLWAQDRFTVGAIGQSRVVGVGYRSAIPEVARAMVNGLLQAFLDDEQLDLQSFETNTRLVNMAELPLRPAFPQRTPFLICGLTLAMVLATAAGVLTYTPSQSGAVALGRTYTRIPILTQIPELRLRRTGNKEVAHGTRGFPLAAVMSLLGSHPPLLDAMRLLHARLALAGFGGELRTLLITSEVAGEGKSFVTLALARLARASGRRVLVVETCLRRPLLGEAFGGPPTAGLAECLRGGPAETVRLGAVPGVDFLLAGDAISDSTGLLSGSRFVSLLDWAVRYDLVLIDSAPVSDLMDAALLAPKVDGVLFCLRAGRPAAAPAFNSLPEMQRANGNVVGLALTFVPEEQIVLPGMGQARAIPAPRQVREGIA